jgi:hypothetical protein
MYVLTVTFAAILEGRSTKQSDKAKYYVVLSVKMEHTLKIMYGKWNI